MSRITPPVSKLSRTVGSSSPAPGRSSTHVLGRIGLLEEASKVVESHHRHIATFTHLTATQHQPRKMPLMQGFRTIQHARRAVANPAVAARRVDRIVLPNLHIAPCIDPDLYSSLSSRVPVVANYSDGATLVRARAMPSEMAKAEADVLAKEAEIHVVAASPGSLTAEPLTDREWVELDRLSEWETARKENGRAQGLEVLGDLWNGLIDDVFGQKAVPAVKLA